MYFFREGAPRAVIRGFSSENRLLEVEDCFCWAQDVVDYGVGENVVERLRENEERGNNADGHEATCWKENLLLQTCFS